MRITAFSVFGASSYLELDMANDDEVLMKDKIVLNIAKIHRKSPAQILLRWAVQRGTFALHKTSTPTRMKVQIDSIHPTYLSVAYAFASIATYK